MRRNPEGQRAPTSPAWPRLSLGSLFLVLAAFPPSGWLLPYPSGTTGGGLSWGESLGAVSWPSIGRTYAVGFCWTAVGFPDRQGPGGNVGVVVKQDDVGVVKPGVGVVRTEVEASGEQVEKAAPASASEGEGLTCAALSAAPAGLKRPSMAEVLSAGFKPDTSRDRRDENDVEYNPIKGIFRRTFKRKVDEYQQMNPVRFYPPKNLRINSTGKETWPDCTTLHEATPSTNVYRNNCEAENNR